MHACTIQKKKSKDFLCFVYVIDLGRPRDLSPPISTEEAFVCFLLIIYLSRKLIFL